MKYWALYFFFFFQGIQLFAQQATLTGSVTDMKGNPVENAILAVYPDSVYGLTDEKGYFQLPVKAGRPSELIASFQGKVDKKTIPAIAPNKSHFVLVKLDIEKVLSGIIVDESRRKDRMPGIIVLNPKSFKKLPSASGNFESILRSLPGVSATSELSSGYNVRGGNFDENLVYVNDIEIYRPQLVRSGQQEGLSFVNPDMVENVTFSAGGFEARYGDKLSSVLDVAYKNPKEFEAGVSLSFLGARAYVGGKDKTGRFKYLVGARYRSNSYLLNTLDVQGSYKPVFGDVQAMLRYDINNKSSISYLGNLSVSRFYLEPESQQTSFGTVTQALLLTIYFEGSERMLYENTTNAISYDIKSGKRTDLKFYVSNYLSSEREYFTTEGAYRLDELDNELGSDRFAKAKFNRGAGYFINHARNKLQMNITNAGHKGKYVGEKSKWYWGVNATQQDVNDKVLEWVYTDSADYSVPINTGDSLYLNSFVSGKQQLSTQRYSGYLQYNTLLDDSRQVYLNLGLRTNYWSLNQQNVISPRVQLTMEPNKKYNDTASDSLQRKDFLVKAAFGYYYQPPFYRELRYLDGSINPDLRAQRSIHFVLGGDYYFKSWGRPFKLYSELYFKKLDDMVPYQVENVRIRYYAENASRGYATGLDTRINGEFVEGLESWFSLSFMSTKEKITYKDANGVKQETDYLRRPTDQRLNFSVFFQDELRQFPRYKMSLLLVYGSNIPYYLGGSYRYIEGYKIPAYRRIDIGFSRDILREDDIRDKPWKKRFKEIWVGLEIFNLTQATNTISYIWVKDFQGNTYGVPAYLTSRRLNLTFTVKF